MKPNLLHHIQYFFICNLVVTYVVTCLLVFPVDELYIHSKLKSF